MSFAQTSRLNAKQLNAVIACFLGWTLASFDFFIMIFVVRDVAKEFGTDITAVTYAVWLTLAMRPLGAFLFGLMADRLGRRPTPVHHILCYSALELPLARRPLGAVLFGRRAARLGRRRPLMLDILCSSALEFASGFAPSLTVL